jgi:hypothetical protein
LHHVDEARLKLEFMIDCWSNANVIDVWSREVAILSLMYPLLLQSWPLGMGCISQKIIIIRPGQDKKRIHQR